MKRNTQVSCIIPFYNEELRPVKVVESIVKVKGISKIIVVDDGSIDNRAYSKIKSRFPQVISIRLKTNNGKVNVVKEGLKYATSDYVLLIDGDLTNIKANEFENAISKIIENPEIGMIILRRVEDKSVAISHWIRHDIIFSGQRILKRADLEKVFENKVDGYQLEVAINTYMVKSKKIVYWIPSSVHNLLKFPKWNFIEGWKIGLEMFAGFVNYAGWRNFIWQTLFFCRKEAPSN